MMGCLVGLTLFMMIYPVESLFNACSEAVVFSVVIVIYSSYLVFRSLAFKSVPAAILTSSLCIVIVSNVSYKEFRGTIMGLSQTLGGLGRFMVLFRLKSDLQGPSLLPSLYAWSCHIHSFPVHHGLPFYVVSFTGLECRFLDYWVSVDA